MGIFWQDMIDKDEKEIPQEYNIVILDTSNIQFHKNTL